MQCECEHTSHFDGRCHGYFQDFEDDANDIVKVKTIFGSFYVCRQCAKEHLANYIERDV